MTCSSLHLTFSSKGPVTSKDLKVRAKLSPFVRQSFDDLFLRFNAKYSGDLRIGQNILCLMLSVDLCLKFLAPILSN